MLVINAISLLLFSSNFGRIAVSHRNTSIVYRLRRSLRIITTCSTISFSFLLSFSCHVEQMYGAYAWRQSEKKVRSGSPRRVKSLNDCRARLHQRIARNAGEIRGVVVPSSRKRPRRHDGHVTTKRKTNVSSFSITFLSWTTKKDAWKSTTML